MIRRFVIIACACAAFVGCGIPEEVHNAKLKELEQLRADLKASTDSNLNLKKELEGIRGESAKLRARLEELGENVQQLLGEKGLLADDLAATKAREERLREEQRKQQERLAKYRQVVEKFQKLVSSGKLKIRVVKGRMVVEMASNILFPSGKANLKEEGEEALKELAEILLTIDGRALQVAGHTDNIPIKNNRFKSNWELSTARAVTVVKFLQEQGLDPEKLSASGYAEYQPAAANDTEEGRAQNRRIEIVLMPNLDELPDLSELGL